MRKYIRMWAHPVVMEAGSNYSVCCNQLLVYVKAILNMCTDAYTCQYIVIYVVAPVVMKAGSNYYETEYRVSSDFCGTLFLQIW